MSDTRNLKYAETLSKIIQYETVSTPDQTDKSRFYGFQELLKQLFPSIFKVATLEDFNASMLLLWPGKDHSRRVMFMNHQDVVPASGNWHYPPFSGAIEEGKVWGRGTLDTKGGLFGMLQAADHLAEEGFVPSCDIYFESGCDEECCGAGCDKISQTLAERGLKFDWVIDEGGMIVTEPIQGAHGTFALVGVGEKSCVDLKFIAKSKGGHASTPGKNEPLVKLGRFMAACEDRKLFDVCLTPTIQKMFKTLAPTMSGATKVLLGHPKFFKPLLEKVVPRISPTANALLATTLAFTRAEGSNANNVLPHEAWVVGNIRTSHHQGQKDSIEKIMNLAAKFDIEVEVIDQGIESGLSDFNSDGFKLISEAVSKNFPNVNACAPYIMTGASDARYMSRVCDNCFRFVPFVIDNQQLGSIHTENECVDVETLAPAIDFYKYVMENC